MEKQESKDDISIANTHGLRYLGVVLNDSYFIGRLSRFHGIKLKV